MKNSNVIQFPKEQMTQKKLRDHKANSKASLGLSLLSVLVVTLFLNQWVINKSSSTSAEQGRGIASIGGSNKGVNIQWEHELAATLSSSKGGSIQGALAEKPSLRDELIFGVLEGKYGMALSGGRIRSLNFIANGQENGVIIPGRKLFLEKYNDAFVVGFAQASLISTADGVESYQLIDSSKAVVGTALVKIDLSGRLQSIQIQ